MQRKMVYQLHTKTLNHFLREKEDIYRRNSELKYACSVIIFDLSDTFFKKMLNQ